jgi:hypothetical protein
MLSFAQDPDTLWTKIYGGSGRDIGFSVTQTLDGGYIIAGMSESLGAGNSDPYLMDTFPNAQFPIILGKVGMMLGRCSLPASFSSNSTDHFSGKLWLTQRLSYFSLSP